MAGRIGVGVSGAGSNLRALQAAAGRGELGGEVVPAETIGGRYAEGPLTSPD